ncbi:MAG: hypothetical protein AB1351_00195 [Thermoproteota archaeon]
MGFGVAISGGIMMMAIVSMVIAFEGGANANYAILSRTSSDRLDADIALLGTSVSIESIQATPNDDTALAVISNIGSEKLWNYENFNVLVTYDANITATKTRLTEELEYAGVTTAVPAGSWGIRQFVDDFADPGIVNSGEKMEIKCRLEHPAYPGGIVTIIISTENGSLASRSGVVS